MNLRISNVNLNENDIVFNETVDQLTQRDIDVYCLEDLFSLPIESTENDIYQVINPIDLSNKEKFKYVQIHREVVHSFFSKHEVL